MSVMKQVGLVILCSVVIIGGLVFFGIRGSADQREEARTFIRHVSDRNFDAMRAMMHPGLAEQFPPGSLAESLGRVAVYEEVSFTGFQSSTATGITVSGTARAADGCESAVTMTFMGGVMTAFNIAPVCEDLNRPPLEEAA
ncbi:MAG: hypothetical protein AAF714_01185 [Pseudomonadota bacterium]